MPKTKQEKIMLTEYGSYLGMTKGKFIVKDKKGNITAEYPVFESEIGEVILKSGNYVSIGTLACLGFWEIDCVILTRRGRPISYLRSTDYDSHIRTRICQYESLKNNKGIHIAKEIVITKLKGENLLLQKYSLKMHETTFQDKIMNLEDKNLKSLRRKLVAIEGKHTKEYFNQIFTLFPKKMRPQKRKTFYAYDGTNNVLNIVYGILGWKCHHAIIRAKLEPYLGYLHSVQVGKPSLVCDFQDLYRYLFDNYVIQFCGTLHKKDFITKTEFISRKRKGKREYLNNTLTNQLTKGLYNHLESKVEIPRIRIGEKQTIETLINEEAYLLAKYLRNERGTWKPRIVVL